MNYRAINKTNVTPHTSFLRAEKKIAETKTHPNSNVPIHTRYERDGIRVSLYSPPYMHIFRCVEGSIVRVWGGG